MSKAVTISNRCTIDVNCSNSDAIANLWQTSFLSQNDRYHMLVMSQGNQTDPSIINMLSLWWKWHQPKCSRCTSEVMWLILVVTLGQGHGLLGAWARFSPKEADYECPNGCIMANMQVLRGFFQKKVILRLPSFDIMHPCMALIMYSILGTKPCPCI